MNHTHSTLDSQQASETGTNLAPVVFHDASIRFQGPPVLKEINFQLGQHETKIVLGPAGVGKSVLLKLTNGLLKPRRGYVELFGQNLNELSEDQLFPLRTRTGMVFQEGALFDSLTIRENVAYQLRVENLPDQEVERRVREALCFVELEHTIELFPDNLSGGMRRRVAIARAIITQPDLLLYDSPTGGLDPVTSNTIIELIVKERDVYHTPALLVTHRLQDALTLMSHHFDSDQKRMVPLPKGETDPNTSFLMLNEGRVLFDGSFDDLLRSEDPFVREFLS
jgi:phospholipid/cholesterol/gamma-HCH transport system ATP-binding protein